MCKLKVFYRLHDDTLNMLVIQYFIADDSSESLFIANLYYDNNYLLWF